MRHTIAVTQIKTYEVTIEASDASEAIASLNEWIDDDFEKYQTGNLWNIEAK